MSNLADVSKLENAILEIIATFKALVFAETLLLGNDHFIDTLIKGRTSIASRASWGDNEVHLCLLMVLNIKSIDLVSLIHQYFLCLKPHCKGIFIDNLPFRWIHTE